MHKHGKILLHKQSQCKGLLRLCASPVCPRTETKPVAMKIQAVSKESIAEKSQVHVNQVQLKEEREHANSIIHKLAKENNKENKEIEKKHAINQEIKDSLPSTIAEANKIIEEDWVVIKSSIRSRVVKEVA